MKTGTAPGILRAALALLLAAGACALGGSAALAGEETKALALYRAGLADHERGDFTAAIIAFNKANALDPELGPEIEPKLTAAYTARGYAYYSRGDYRRAIADFEELRRLHPESPDVRRMQALLRDRLRGGPPGGGDPAVAVRRGLLRIAELQELHRLRHGEYTSDSRALAELSNDMNGLKAQLADVVIPGSLHIDSNGADFMISAEVRAPGRPAVSVGPADVAAFARNIRAKEEEKPGVFQQVFDILSIVVPLLVLIAAVPWGRGYRWAARLVLSASAPAAPKPAPPPPPPPPPAERAPTAAELLAGNAPLGGLPPQAGGSEAPRVPEAASEGKYQEALAALLKKPQQRLALSDYCLLFELYLQLGDLVRAGLVLSTIDGEIAARYPVERGPAGPAAGPGGRKGALPPDPQANPEALAETFRRLARLAGAKARPDLVWQLDRLAADCLLGALPPERNPGRYYALADSFERDGAFERAVEFFGLIDYQDSAQRREKLRPRVQPGPPRPPAQQRPAPPPGALGAPAPALTLAGRYELRSTVAAGGMGVVYEGLDRRSGLPVAVKQMHSYLKEYPEEYERFRKEAAIVGRLNHPNIVAIYELVEQGGEIYLVFEYVAGKTLYARLKEKKQLTLEDCKKVFAGVCPAVEYAHENGVIHRDLKPPNIMLADSGKAMVMDFGLACTLRDGLTRVSHNTSSGTPAYMAPEQHSGVVKREADVYSMGVCLYEMLTGSLPFPGMDSRKQKQLKDYREAGSILPWLPHGVDAVISRALEPEPEQRYAGAAEFWAALKGL